jgi:hypothetical protein
VLSINSGYVIKGKIYDLYKSPSTIWKVKLGGKIARHDEGRAKNAYGIIHIQYEDGSSGGKM